MNWFPINRSDADKIDEVLGTLFDLYAQARDVYDAASADHRHLRESLLETAEILLKYRRIDNQQFALICQVMDESEVQ